MSGRSSKILKCLFTLGLVASLSAADIPAQVIIDVTVPGLTIPADFLGISYEKNALVEPHFKADNIVLINLHRNLGAGTLRLGGNKVELTRWQADAAATILDKKTGQAIIGRAPIDDLYGFLRATQWKCLHGLNLASNAPEQSADEAAYALKVGASSVLAFEVGNEPNLYVNHAARKDGYNCAQYLPEAQAAIKVIRAKNPGIVLAGPATARRTDHWFEDAVAGLKGQLQIGTSHLYALSGGSTNPQSANFPTVENLLLPATMAKDLQMVDEHRQAAQAAGMRYRLAEFNSVSNGGRTGVSDTFVSALWATDFLFSVAEHGADGVNFHCNLKPGSYSPISAVKSEATYTVHPLYYAMLLFHDAGQGRLLPTKVKSTANLVAHATLDASGKVRVVLVNKDLTQEVVATVHVANRLRSGSVRRLSAPQATAKDGVTYADTTVSADGRWQRTLATEKAVAAHNGRAVVSLPPASALVLTLTE
ncbi:MAG: glycosyl hydrolase family 79 C-terminal domain-containing protein [Verrucomicrobia bacterium]|nr:glycosyl hydrolase family 79 C-terminal domain-containing protein [Verrucomicrobiota bacterium]